MDKAGVLRLLHFNGVIDTSSTNTVSFLFIRKDRFVLTRNSQDIHFATIFVLCEFVMRNGKGKHKFH